MLYSEIDLHKRTAVVSTVNERGQVVAEATLPTSWSAVSRYFRENCRRGRLRRWRRRRRGTGCATSLET